MYRTVFLKNSITIIFLMLLMGCKTSKQKLLPFYNTPDFTPLFFKTDFEVKDKVTHTISDFSFTDQNNKNITQKNIEGKIHVANFFFTSCGSICPAMMKNMKLVNIAFANDSNVVILSYSVTPWIDSVAKLKRYATNMDFDKPNWHLVTGSKASIYTLARTSYFAEEDLGFSRDSTNFLHTEHFLLIDKDKHIRGIYNGTLQLEAEQMIADIKMLREE